MLIQPKQKKYLSIKLISLSLFLGAVIMFLLKGNRTNLNDEMFKLEENRDTVIFNRNELSNILFSVSFPALTSDEKYHRFERFKKYEIEVSSNDYFNHLSSEAQIIIKLKDPNQHLNLISKDKYEFEIIDTITRVVEFSAKIHDPKNVIGVRSYSKNSDKYFTRYYDTLGLNSEHWLIKK